KKKVMIVDDSEFVRNTLKRIVSENGCEVVGEATEGTELLSILKTKSVDLVILDIKMPGMDGITALKHIKSEYPKVKVIMCSAMTDQQVIDSVIELGANGYVTKPFLPEAIIYSIGNI
ncbi:response regulator, partial [Cutibacterium acnes]